MDTFADRPRQIDYARLDTLQYLGNYVRRLPVNMARMMENALDWEHLPYVHGSSFAALERLQSGSWGWRARALPAGEGQAWQLLELLLDSERHYWATSVVEGPAANVEIHTQAIEAGPDEIEVDVRFYSSAPLAEEESALYLDVLQQQYALLYDEDEILMSGRQAALDARQERSQRDPVVAAEYRVDLQAQSQDSPITVDTDHGKFCVRKHEEEWVAHGAVCPHLLGPLTESDVSPGGVITCPWHGYQFDARTGASVDGKCRALPTPPAVLLRDDTLILRFPGEASDA